jgi:predicted transcriptional regulator
LHKIRRVLGDNKRNDSTTEYFSENKLYIYKYILNTAGVHLRKICRELGLAMGDTQYHLSILEKEGRIKSRKIDNHRQYYPVTIPNEQNELFLAFLRQETTRDILVYLMENPGSTQQDLASYKNVSSPTVKWHMYRLIESDLVLVAREGRVVKYFIKDPRNLTSSIKDFMPTLWDSLANRFAEKFLEISLVRPKDNNRK